MAEIKVVILAGGQGTRFWPVSRMKFPKQFLSISESGESLIQATARRIEPLASKENIMVATNVVHKEQIIEHVPYAEVVAEPVGRNTAASIGLSALHVAKKNPETVMIVLPADHVVENEAKLRETLWEAIELAADEGLLVTVGIKPTRPDTAYGYIKRGAALKNKGAMVARFYEKPSLERAVSYLESEDFFWNSGMFVWRASVFLDAVREFMPELHQGLMKIEPALSTDNEERVVKEVFDGLESVSVDFGILEHARNCAVIEARPYGWNDVGSWDAWAQQFDADQDGNVSHGELLSLGAKNCIVYSPKRPVAVVAAQDLVIIDGEDALLVCPRDEVQDVKKVVQLLKDKNRKELI